MKAECFILKKDFPSGILFLREQIKKTTLMYFRLLPAEFLEDDPVKYRI